MATTKPKMVSEWIFIVDHLSDLGLSPRLHPECVIEMMKKYV